MKMIIFVELFLLFLLSLLIKNNKNNKKIINKNLLIKKGKYLSTLANCITCHTPIGSKPFSGGLPIKTKFGTLFTPNITSDKTNGIGNIKLKEFKNSIKHGISKNNNFLYPIFPYLNYSNLKNIDINSIYVFLKSLPGVKKKNIKYKLNFPLNYKNLILGWRLLFFKKNNKNYKKLTSSLKRGEYITNNLGHCNMCHTKNNNLESNIKKLNYSGNLIGNSNWYSIPLVNNSKLGIKNKTIQELTNILNWGKSKKKTILGPMAEIINNSLQNINKIEINSISSYLKIIINKNIKNIKSIKKEEINKENLKIFFKKGKILFNNNCVNCHGKLTLGNFPIYSKINKNIINTDFKENIFNILKYTNNNNTFKNKFSSIMKNFFNLIKVKDWYYITNYLLILNKIRK